jgi:hypothetical protein
MSRTAKNTIGNTEATDAPVVLELGADLSPVVKAIESAYGMIQRRYKDTPNATIVVKRDRFAWGHTTVGKAWAGSAHSGDATHFEIMISGENLRRGAVHVAATLLHEAAHARNLQAGILDTDSNGRHNLKFKARAEEHGLTITNVGWIGWSGTELGEDGQAAWKQLVSTIERGLAKSAAPAPVNLTHLGITGKPEAPAVEGGEAPVITPGAPVAPPVRGPRNLLRTACGCRKANGKPQWIIRMSQGALDACTPTCQTCGEAFAEVA